MPPEESVAENDGDRTDTEPFPAQLDAVVGHDLKRTSFGPERDGPVSKGRNHRLSVARFRCLCG
jgi:hypothetical protein